MADHSDEQALPPCTVNVCDAEAVVRLRTAGGVYLRYCTDHLWLIEQSDRDVALIGRNEPHE